MKSRVPWFREKIHFITDHPPGFISRAYEKIEIVLKSEFCFCWKNWPAHISIW